MRAVRLIEYNGPDAVEIVDVDEPFCDGNVLVDLHVEVPDMTESERRHECPNAEDTGVQMKAQLILPRRSSVMP